MLRETRSHSGSLVQLLRQTRLLPIRGILMNDALGRGLVNHGGSHGQQLLSILRISFYSGIELPDRSAHPTLHNTIPQVLLLTDLHALLRGLDICQLGSPPLRMP